MTRTKLRDRILPAYTTGEEIFNMVTHIVGAVFGVAALVLCVLLSAQKSDAWGVVSGAIYGASLILLYAMSSLYHGLRSGMGKRVMQVLDHCTIYFLIGGTYTPILLTKIRQTSAPWAWVIFGLVWGFAALATVLTAIDIQKYARFSMACYIGMGWCIVLAAKTAIEAIAMPGLLWLLGGGVAYTVGAILYGIGKKKRYVHSVFHLFVLAGSVLQFICIYFFVL